MMRIKPIIFIMLLLPVISCEQTEKLGWQPEEETPVRLSLGTKGLPEGQHTYRVTLTGIDGSLKGEGTYCSLPYVASTPENTWLSPCLVNTNGEPLVNEGHVAESLEDADKDPKNGLRYPTGRNTNSYLFISAASPAVELVDKQYYVWKASEALYLSDSMEANFEGSWFNREYIFDFSKLHFIDRRAKLAVRIECGAQDSADIQSVKLTYVNQARWNLPGSFSTVGYTTDTVDDWFDCNGDVSQILKLIKPEEGEEPEPGKHYWESPYGQYVLPLDYSNEKYSSMRPQIEVKRGRDVENPGIIQVSLSEKIEPMKNYRLTLRVSKSIVKFELQASDWEDGGLWETDENEKWATISTGITTLWDELPNEAEDLKTDEWNNSWE